MKILLLSAISLVFAGSAYAVGPNDIDMSSASAAEIEADAGNAVVSASDAQAARDAADDLEFERLMAEAPDEGVFGDSVIVDKTGAEIRVSGFGFNNE